MVKVAGVVDAGRCSFDRILVDMNTQCDLLLPTGAMPVINRAEVLPNIQRMVNWARVESLPVVSSLECRRVGESSRGLPPYCIDGTAGQRKVPITLLPRRVVVHNDNTPDIPSDPFRKIQQMILIKRSGDFLSNPKVDRLFHAVSVNHLVVFGAVAERCVKSVVLGFLARWHRVGVVTDACGAWRVADANQALRQMEAKGAILVTTDDLISGAADERLRRRRSAYVAEEQEPAHAEPDRYTEPFCWS